MISDDSAIAVTRFCENAYRRRGKRSHQTSCVHRVPLIQQPDSSLSLEVPSPGGSARPFSRKDISNSVTSIGANNASYDLPLRELPQTHLGGTLGSVIPQLNRLK